MSDSESESERSSVLGFGSDNPREDRISTHQHHAWRGSLVGARELGSVSICFQPRRRLSTTRLQGMEISLDSSTS